MADYKASNRVIFSLLVVLAWASFPSSAAHAQEQKELTLKLAFIYNFAKFITWPEGAFKNEYDTLNICLSEFDAFDSAIRVFGDKKVGNRNVRFSDADQIEDLSICDIVYFHQGKGRMVAGYDRKGLLSISNASDAHSKDSAIKFFQKNNKLRFSIDIANVNKAGLSVNSRLLRLAEL